jgi:hypothetical protein
MNAETIQKPAGYVVTIERRSRATGKLEQHSFESRHPSQTIARKAATYKHGFQRLLKIEPLSGERRA